MIRKIHLQSNMGCERVCDIERKRMLCVVGERECV